MIRNGNFVKNCLINTQFGKVSPNGFDLSLKEVKKIQGTGIIDSFTTVLPEYISIPKDESDIYVLEQGIYSITFNEGGKIFPNHCGMIKPRSSLVRSGAFILSGLYDTGFECENFGAILYVINPFGIRIKSNSIVAQLILIYAEQTFNYNGRWQKEKDIK